MIFCRLLVPTFEGNYFADFVTHFAVSTIASKKQSRYRPGVAQRVPGS